MRFGLVLAASSALALAACSGEGAADGGETTVDDPSDPDQVAAAMDSLPTRQPGLYMETAELVEAELVGASEEEQQGFNMFFQAGSKQENEVCKTEDEVAGGAEEFLAQMEQLPEECEMQGLTVNGGNFETNLICDAGEEGTGTVQVAGTISETSSDVTMTMDMQMPGGEQSMRLVFRQQSERTGDCPANG